ncbi:PTS sugar transporter subunit IIA [Roseateles koreensis]|uniref:PTS fructose transporter subunit IIA n=1 Tax=Roseateles koreensis TaxID=2987526 RepID=A0ABT5KV85_9BURK|nr:PTS fructose transporter subunit IIA [Roseateles koreensis]MDC8786855.1 PTS fructose transporter subunit IIA [Roseateles koreensis]
MPGLLVIAHAPLASALKAVAEHTFPQCAAQLSVLDVMPDMSQDMIEAQARALLVAAGHAECLVLTDVFGASPHNAALRLRSDTVQVLCGVNAPMLWRSLCYACEPLAVLAQRALEGGTAGIMLCNESSSNFSSKP